MGFRLVPKSVFYYSVRSPVTLNGIMAIILHYFAEFGSSRGRLRKVVD